MLWVTVAQLFCYTIFCLKHKADPKWLAWSAATTKCNLQGPAMSRKHQPMNLGYFISQIMQKAWHPSYPIKSNLTITSLIHTLGFKASSIDQKQSLSSLRVQYKRLQSDSKSTNHVLPTNLKLQSKNSFSQSTISQFQNLGVKIWVQGNLPSLPHNFLNFLFSLTMGQSFRLVKPCFSHRAET